MKEKEQSMIIPARDPRVIQAELREQLMLRKTNRASHELYTFRATDAPNTMLEVGRLREQAFRMGGGGTGSPADIDEKDLDPKGYQQLIVWDPKSKSILGGYRYILGEDVKRVGEQTSLSSNEIFHFSETFIKDYIPYSIELGRSFVVQDLKNGQPVPCSIFALDNLWDGLGALMLLHDKYQYFFGKVTMYQDYNRKARDLIAYYLQKYYQGGRELMSPLYPIEIETPLAELTEVVQGEDAKEVYQKLSKAVRDMGTTIPPLVNAYVGLSDALMVFGTSLNPFFGNVEETAIMLPIEAISNSKVKRHINTFLRDASIGIHPSVLQRIAHRLGLSRPKSTNSKA